MTSDHTRQLAMQALSSGDIDGALDHWRRHCGGDPTPADLLEYLQLLWATYHLSDAVPVQERLLHHPATTALQCLGAAKELFNRHRVRESVRFTARALSLDPGNPDTAAMHAASLERSGEPGEARELLSRTLHSHPDHLRSIRLLAHIERVHGETARVIQRLSEQLSSRQTPEDWRLRYELAPALESAGDPEGAMRELLAAKRQLAPQSGVHHRPWRDLTRRQWELASALDRRRLESWQASSAGVGPPLKVCLLAGFPRSGTTLLENILDAHPDCIGTDESGILASQFRDPLVVAAPGADHALAELDSLDSDALTAGRHEYLRCTCEYLGEPLGDRVLIEKEPLLTADLPVPLRLFPEARILMPLRDPRDVVISFFFTIVPLVPNSVAAADLGDSCRYYAEVMRHWLHFRGMLPADRWMESRYEDLLADPGRQTGKLAEFLGIEWMPSMLSHHRNASRKTVSTPTYSDVSKPLYTRSMNRWVHYQRWLEPHLHHLEPYITAFGYS